jgi:hypothetical protein
LDLFVKKHILFDRPGQRHIKVGDISATTLSGIEKSMDEEFIKWKIKKVQVQWLGEEERGIESIKQGEAGKGIIEIHEIRTKVKVDKILVEQNKAIGVRLENG